MLLKLKREQSLKLKISIVFIWIIALTILLNALYDAYLMCIGEYEYPAFNFVSSFYSHYLFMGFGVLVAIGLLFHSKVARWVILLLAYIPLFGAIYYLLIYGTTKGTPIYLFVLSIGFNLLTIYLFSHEDIRKVFRIKYLKWEIIVFFLLTILLYVLFTYSMKSMTDDEIEHKIVLESNSSVGIR
jgi:glucan phosphoethanolaminetransferase (alkaline phosphatase superfamily)